MTPLYQGIGARMAKGAAWMIAFRLLDRSVGMISTIILARLLVPEDFGLIAMAMAVIAIVEMIQAFGFDTALIQNSAAGREDFDTAWTLNMALAAACGAILAVAAAPVAAFYGDPRVEAVIYCLAAGTLVQGFENIGIVAFRKDLALHKDFWFMLGKKLASFVIVVSCALVMRSYWALVIGMVSGRVIGVALSYYMHPYRPRFSVARAGALFNFSKWMVLTNAVNVMRSRVITIVIGRIEGAHVLGLFSVSQEISHLPTSELSAPINRAVFPGYSLLAADTAALAENFRKVISLIWLVTVPAAIGIAAVAEPLVLTLLGDNWADAVPLIRVLAFCGLIGSLQSNLSYVFLATGRARFITLWSAIMLALQVPIVVYGTLHYGILGAALALLVSLVLTMPFVLHLLGRVVGMRPRDWLALAWRPVLAAALMAAAVIAWLSFTAAFTGIAGSQVVRLLSSVLIGAGAYTGIAFGLWVMVRRPAGPEAYLCERVVSFLRRPAS